MGLTIVERPAAESLTRGALGVSADAPLDEIVGTALRRAASVNCPTTPGALTASVAGSLVPVLQVDDLEDLVAVVLERLVAIGDLVESVEERAGVRRSVLYLGAPRFVRRANGDALLIGVRPDGLPLVSDDLQEDVDQLGHVRRITSRDDLPALLEGEGLREVAPGRWLHAPDVVDPVELIAAYNSRLDAASSSGEIEGLRILDPSTPNTYYRGRWRQPAPEHTGNVIARRGQRYGAELWAYVALDGGAPARLLDLPALTTERGCDEAWRLQAAIDAANGRPQQIVVRGTGQGRLALGLYAPPPRWLQRRWELIGQPAKVPGALFAYEFTPSEAREELPFASDRLWLTRHVASAEGTQ